MNELEKKSRDRLVSIAKAVAGALPLIGNLVGEILDTIVPNLRFERVVDFLKNLEANVADLKDRVATFEKHLKTEEGLDIFEEGITQSSRAVSKQRKVQLARLVTKSLSTEDLKYEEGKKLLHLYKELTDPEIVWLIFYSLNPVLGRGPHSDWVEKHPEILGPIRNTMGAPRNVHEKAALQNSYKATLLRLGLTEERGRGTHITILGQMLVSYIFNEKDL